ncbi:dihydrofolate reductase family protein [Amycolatopsis ultiminotia]|uniref:Dihydrofolate reductase family protein n=1 Tax=Amycolatopsis ultiminotia TaxID=543629 RepID=A0ABP6X7I5_9PSEU
MGKLLYSATMSLDGFIAGPGGDMGWLTRYIGPNQEAEDLVTEIGALLVGRRTFTGDDPHRGTEGEGKAFGGGWDGPQFVLSRHPPAEPVAGVTFVSDLAHGVAEAKAAAGEKSVNVLGAAVARACVDAALLDEVAVFVAPVLLGGGVRLFERPEGAPVPLERISQSAVPLATNLRFRVLR